MKIKYLLVIMLVFSACTKTVTTPENLQNKIFPSVVGRNLNKEIIKIPNDYNGQITLLLVGYLQKSQFDIDRWILGALQADLGVKIVEIPTIAGMMPRAVQGFIDNGMRSGIPKEDWADVVTVYEDADKIIAAIGNQNPQNAQVLLLDQNGKIVWNYNRGYSAREIINLKKLVTDLTLKTQG